MGTKKRYLFWMHKSKARISIILSPDTACCREKQLKQKIPKGFSIFPSKVMLGGSESVEKTILQQSSEGATAILRFLPYKARPAMRSEITKGSTLKSD